MGFVVEAWFHNTSSDVVAKILRYILAAGGFTPVKTPTTRKDAWNLVTLNQHKVFVTIDPLTENHLDVVVQADVIPLEGGVILDCGWTREFALPASLSSI